MNRTADAGSGEIYQSTQVPTSSRAQANVRLPSSSACKSRGLAVRVVRPRDMQGVHMRGHQGMHVRRAQTGANEAK